MLYLHERPVEGSITEKKDGKRGKKFHLAGLEPVSPLVQEQSGK